MFECYHAKTSKLNYTVSSVPYVIGPSIAFGMCILLNLTLPRRSSVNWYARSACYFFMVMCASSFVVFSYHSFHCLYREKHSELNIAKKFNIRYLCTARPPHLSLCQGDDTLRIQLNNRNYYWEYSCCSTILEHNILLTIVMLYYTNNRYDLRYDITYPYNSPEVRITKILKTSSYRHNLFHISLDLH